MANGAHVHTPRTAGHAHDHRHARAEPTAEPKKPRFEFLTDAEFVAGDYRQEFLITNVLAKGQPCGIGGPVKAMKTGLSVDMALSLGTGTPFLGTFAVTRAVTTVMVSGESGRATLLETRDRIMKAKGFPPAQPFGTLHWCFDVPRLSDAAAMAEFTEMLVARKPEVVILDPLYLKLGDVNAASMFETGDVLKNVGTKLIAAGITTVICHHANRSLDVGKPMELQHLSHAGFSQFVGQYVLINRRKEYVKGTGRHELVVGIGGRDGYGGQYHVDIEEGVADECFRSRVWDVRITNTADAPAGPAGSAEDKEAKKAGELRQKMAAKKAKFLADVDAEKAKGFPAVSANRLKTDYHWQFTDIKAIADCLMQDGQIELHTFKFKAGKGAPQETTGFRRAVPRGADRPAVRASAGFFRHPTGSTG
ncbi:AAA family ATPase [Limnoglobus roseus]|uniref:AAA family ATPase n=1 Tax=Limnoglobus roseus TaxID=2598579 RepID=A0A5C1ARE0_9BACT|nr:AAA family ATPase [Limnoglobus roseus]QEL20767.1 hypothetical protein PX52LOC_07881 [Limnoglobus roseus]